MNSASNVLGIQYPFHAKRHLPTASVSHYTTKHRELPAQPASVTMDKKSRILDHGLQDSYLSQTTSSNNARRRGLSAYFRDLNMHHLCYAMCLALTAWFMLHTAAASYRRCRLSATRPDLPTTETILAQKNVTKVALEAHIMSKCPDAKACLEQFIVPSMVQISDKVDFRLSYIGRSVRQSLHACTPSL
jgi:hypothetical protein